MPIPAALVGTRAGPRSVTLSARRIMAFAAGTGDRNSCYFDDTGPEPVVAPPLLSVFLEWPLIVALRGALAEVRPDEVRRGVHATHDLVFHRLARAGETLHTTATIVALEQRPSGTALITRLDTVDDAGTPVVTTFNGGVYRGVELIGGPVRLDGPAPAPAAGADGGWSGELQVPWDAAHVYTECADIWNPIHTERSVALAAGLPEIILHGTATLGFAAQAVVDRACGSDPSRLRRLSARFGAMVFPGSTLTLAIGPATPVDGGVAHGFRITTQDAGPAIRNGVAVVGPPLSNWGR
jgi:acyl dehydratase